MGQWLLGGAALVAFGAFLTHILAGQRIGVRPLLASNDLPHITKWLAFLCWHVVTLLFLNIAVFLGVAAVRPLSTDLLVFIAVVSGCIAALSAAVALRAGLNPLRFPATYVLALVAALTTAGLLLFP